MERGNEGPIRALLVIGTRPEAIKLAPVILEMQRRPTFEPLVCLTAQHRQLLDEPLKLFGIEANFDLDLMRQVQDPMDVVARALPGLSKVMRDCQPDVTLVQGDTTTAFCGAFAAFHAKCLVGHVEAGLRTGRRYEPFPEEMNRRLVTPLSDIHFAPTLAARRALLAERVSERSIFVTGNTVVDAVLAVAAMPAPELPILQALSSDRRLVLVTCHRRENHGEIQRGIFRALKNIVRYFDDVEVVFPVHPHPNVRAAADEVLKGEDRVHLTKPLAYRDFMALLQRATLVVTDSGGVQEEAPSLKVPVVVLRRATERQEGVDAGTALLAGHDPAEIVDTVKMLLSDDSKLLAMQVAANPYGDGKAAERICNVLEGSLRDSVWLSRMDGSRSERSSVSI